MDQGERRGGWGSRRGILVPREVETSTIEVLHRTVEAADRLNLPMATHAAYSVIEFYETVREHMMTPIELLEFDRDAAADTQHRTRQFHLG